VHRRGAGSRPNQARVTGYSCGPGMLLVRAWVMG
jgi:hypothetical protein